MVRLKDIMPKTVILLIGTKSGMSKTIQSRASSARTAPVAAPKKVLLRLNSVHVGFSAGISWIHPSKGQRFASYAATTARRTAADVEKPCPLLWESFMPCVIASTAVASSMCSCYRFYGRRHDSTETTRDMIAKERARTTHDTTKKGENTVFSMSF